MTTEKTIPYVLGSDSITVYFKGKPFTINKQAQTYPAVLKAIQQNDLVKLEQAVNIKEAIISTLNKSSLTSLVKIDGNKIFYEDREIQGLVSTRVFEMIALGLDIKPMILFIENLMLNPSKRAVDELLGFLEVCTLPITSDGHFIAYKRVNTDFTDVYSGTLDNSVGKVLTMPRNLVDEDKNRTCSAGLHFCSFSYLNSFSGAKVVAVKINPKDVVAIPSDYNNSKGRTCRYEVVEELVLDEQRLPKKLQEGYTEKHGKAEQFQNVLSDAQVRSIRYDYLVYGSYSLKEIADLFEVSSRTIARIRDGKTYKHVK